MSQLFASGGQSTGTSASASVLPMNIQGWFPLELTDLSSFLSKGLSSLLQHHSSKASVLRCSAFFMVQFSHLCMTIVKTIVLTIWTLLAKWCLLFNMPSRFVIAFLPRSKNLLISWLQSPPAVILEPKKIKSITASAFYPSCHELMVSGALNFVFWMLNVDFWASFFTLLFHSRQEAL